MILCQESQLSERSVDVLSLPTKHHDDDDTVSMDFDGRTLQVPSFMMCPLTLDIMSWPVVNVQGHNFEKNAILQWLVTSRSTCPLTRKSVKASDFISNHRLRLQIQEWKRYHGLPVDEHEEEFGTYPLTGSWAVPDEVLHKFLREYAGEREPGNMTDQISDGPLPNRQRRSRFRFNILRRSSWV